MNFKSTIHLTLLAAAPWFGACTAEKKPLPLKPTAYEIQYTPNHPDSLRIDSIFKTWNKQMRFNGNILVAQQGKIIYENALGWADYQNRDSLNINSVFQLASVSKQFTAVAVLQLVQQHKINLTDTITRFFPGFPYDGITVHQLLAHRSGLPKYMFFCDEYTDTIRALNFAILDTCIQRHKPPRNYQPDKRFQYNNTNYVLLAAIVEKISGMKFQQYMHRHVFEPLQMHETRIFTLQFSDSIPRHLTYGHNYRYQRIESDFLDGIPGDKGIYSTVHDLLKWDQALYSDILLADSLRALAFSPHGLAADRLSNYGYGFRIRYTPDLRRIIYHGGWWHGYNTLLIRDVERRNTIIILANKRNRTLRTLADTILNTIEPLDSSMIPARRVADELSENE